MKYLFVVNPVSGKRDAEAVLVPQIHQFFSGKQLDYAVEITAHPKHATEIVQSYARAGEPLRVCACGGDGTLNEVVCGAIGNGNVEVTCYPTGSGNDFIRCFGGAEGFLNFDGIVSGSSVLVDVLTVNDSYCVNIVSVGLDADICGAILKYRKFKFLRGPMAYNLALLECAFLRPMGKQLRVEIGGEPPFDGNFILAVAGNGQVYGGGYKALPEAKVDDGLLDIVTVDKMGILRVAKMISVYKKGNHIVDGEIIPELRDKIRFRRADSIKMNAQQAFVVNVDGETFVTNSLEIGIKRQALRFIAPRQPAD